MHFGLCVVVTVRMKVLPNGTLVRFSKLTDWWRAFSCSIFNQTATSLGVSRVTIRKVITKHTDHGKTTSAEKKTVAENYS